MWQQYFVILFEFMATLDIIVSYRTMVIVVLVMVQDIVTGVYDVISRYRYTVDSARILRLTTKTN